MPLVERRPIRPARWAFRFPPLPAGAWLAGLGMILSLTILLSDSVPAQAPGPGREPVHHQNASGHDHAGVAGSGWEGSPEGKAYSEFNHHTAGVFVRSEERRVGKECRCRWAG